jgi:hypothetical protein
MRFADFFYNNYLILCCVILILTVNHFFNNNIANFLIFLLVLCLLCSCISYIETQRSIGILKDLEKNDLIEFEKLNYLEQQHLQNLVESEDLQNNDIKNKHTFYYDVSGNEINSYQS